MQRFLAETIDAVLLRWTARRVQLHRRTLWPDADLVRQLREGTLPPLDFSDPGVPSDVELTPVARGPKGPDQAFRFASSAPYALEHDHDVYGALFLPAGEPRGAVVMLPGAFTGADGTQLRLYHRIARRFNANGIAAALLEAPLHQQRTRPGEISGHDFLHGDLFVYLRALAQATRDARGTVGWLSSAYGPTGYWGLSLGAQIGSAVVPREPRLAFAVLVQPPNRGGGREAALTGTWSRQLQESGLTAEDLDLASALVRSDEAPSCGVDRVLIQACRYDKIAPPAGVRELAERWGGPSVRWYDHGHISLLLTGSRWFEEGVRFGSDALADAAEAEIVRGS